ncbi:MAG: hypothetical protein OSB21_14790, partial [Myxococcota bacterium]|nr:hypothetical protein [Myxococcota bacterium]
MKNTPHKAALLFACFMMACSQGVLPQIPPERNERIPTSVELVAAPERLVAGAWGQIEASVLDQFGLAMAGQIINLAVQVEGQTLGLVPALGNTCSTGLEGERCSVVVRSEGQQGVYNLVLSSSSAAPLSLVIHVDAAPDTAHLFVEMPESTFEFVNGGRDYLINVPPLELALRQAPVEVTLKLLDQYGNPIAAMLSARVLSETPVAQADAGPQPDAAATDAAATD